MKTPTFTITQWALCITLFSAAVWITISESACTTQYGWQLFQVHFETSPPDAKLYVIPEGTWLKYKNTLISDDPESIARRQQYRCYDGKMNVEFMNYILLIEANGKKSHRLYRPINPEETTKVIAE